MATRIENTAVIRAISIPDTTRRHTMTHEQFTRELSYQALMCTLRNLFCAGLFDEEEYLEAQKILLEKYRPLIGQQFAGCA